VKRALLVLVVIVSFGATMAWYYHYRQARRSTPATAPAADAHAWLDALYSQNPREVEAATQEVQALGVKAVPIIQSTLRDHESEAERIKAALKAAGLLGRDAAAAIPEVSAVLPEPGVTAEAALALSFMGRDAFKPLHDALSSQDPMVRREALRSIGKLKDRASLDAEEVLPLLVAGLKDGDEGVRAVAATYLGIIHQAPDTAVPALIEGLSDPDPEVRRASAAALGEFGEDAKSAIPALKKAAGDKNEDTAREAGRALVRLQTPRTR
jgi:HEAT repeat protein